MVRQPRQVAVQDQGEGARGAPPVGCAVMGGSPARSGPAPLGIAHREVGEDQGGQQLAQLRRPHPVRAASTWAATIDPCCASHSAMAPAWCSPEIPHVREAGVAQHPGDLFGVELPRRGRGWWAWRPGPDPARTRGGWASTRRSRPVDQHPTALAEELPEVPQVLDDLQRHQCGGARVQDRQRGQVAAHGAHPRVRGRDVGDSRDVVVQRDRAGSPAARASAP